MKSAVHDFFPFLVPEPSLTAAGTMCKPPLPGIPTGNCNYEGVMKELSTTKANRGQLTFNTFALRPCFPTSPVQPMTP
jgi:hypothetical protein